MPLIWLLALTPLAYASCQRFLSAAEDAISFIAVFASASLAPLRISFQPPLLSFISMIISPPFLRTEIIAAFLQWFSGAAFQVILFRRFISFSFDTTPLVSFISLRCRIQLFIFAFAISIDFFRLFSLRLDSISYYFHYISIFIRHHCWLFAFLRFRMMPAITFHISRHFRLSPLLLRHWWYFIGCFHHITLHYIIFDISHWLFLIYYCHLGWIIAGFHCI